MDLNFKFKGWREKLLKKLRDAIRDYWGVLCEDELYISSQGFVLQVYTRNHPPICLNPPQYGPHESSIIIKLVSKMYDNCVLKDNFSPWVYGGYWWYLLQRISREMYPVTNFICDFFVSYKWLYQVTSPFFSIPWCNDSV